MKYLVSLFLIVSTLIVNAQFEKYFHDNTLRIDYYHSGNNETEFYTFSQLLEEPYWGGSKVNLIDTFNYGKYYFKVFDVKTDSLLYSRGYSTLFGEWQTTDEAKTTSRSLMETVVMPFPKDDVRVEFYSRNKKGIFEKKFEYNVDVDSYFIKPERNLEYPAFDVHISGDPAKKVDIVILPEGYSKNELGLFINDCQKFTKLLFSFSPYSENKDKFNIRAVLAASEESGMIFRVIVSGKKH